MDEQHESMNTDELWESLDSQEPQCQLGLQESEGPQMSQTPQDSQEPPVPQALSETGLDITILADEIEVTDGIEDADAREKRHAVYRERIKHFILMNDPLMRVVFDDNETLEYLLRVVMKKPDLSVVSKTIQADYKNLMGRSVTLDIVAVDGEGMVYNIEIQQRSEGAVPERARYNAGMVDSKELHESEDFTKLPNSFIIFITDKDESENILSEDVVSAVRERGR